MERMSVSSKACFTIFPLRECLLAAKENVIQEFGVGFYFILRAIARLVIRLIAPKNPKLPLPNPLRKAVLGRYDARTRYRLLYLEL
jgi:hypothetical protein